MIFEATDRSRSWFYADAERPELDSKFGSNHGYNCLDLPAGMETPEVAETIDFQCSGFQP